jgi:hypothetical protein
MNCINRRFSLSVAQRMIVVIVCFFALCPCHGATIRSHSPSVAVLPDKSLTTKLPTAPLTSTSLPFPTLIGTLASSRHSDAIDRPNFE